MATPTYELIETTTLSSSASSVTFSSITQDYRDLVLVINNLHVSSFAVVYVQMNNDTTNGNYLFVIAEGNGTSASSTSVSSSLIPTAWSFSSGGTTPNTQIYQIMDYSATDKHKPVLLRGNTYDAGVTMLAGRYASVSAITSLDVVSGSSDFASGTTVSLYGIAS